MNDKERAEFYLKNAQIVEQVLAHGNSQPALINVDPINGEEEENIAILVESGSDWEIRQVILNRAEKSLKYRSTNEILDLHNYLLRTSKKKDKHAFVLESIDPMQFPQTVRITNYKQPIEEVSQMLKELIYSAIQDNIQKMLQKDNVLSKKRASLTKMSNGLNTGTNGDPNLQSPPYKLVQIPEEEKSKQIPFINSNKKISLAENMVNIDQNKIQQIITGMNSNNGFNLAGDNVYYANESNLNPNAIRKTYKFNALEISFQWLCDQLFDSSAFKKWKTSLVYVQEVKRISQNLRGLCQSHKYKMSSNLPNFIYKYNRQKIGKDTQKIYFVDASANTNKGQPYIEYCVWNFTRDHTVTIKLTVEASITHSSKLSKKQNQILSDEYLGDFSQLLKDLNVNMNDTDMHINTKMFQDQYVSMIDFIEPDDPSLDDFLSINNPDQSLSMQKISSQYFQEENKKNQDKMQDEFKRKEEKNNLFNHAFQSFKKPNSLKRALDLNSHNLLKFRHPMVPYDKETPKLNIPKKGHLYWQGQWKINEKGQLVSINEAKLAAQYGILKKVLISIGRNLFSGKSILNISLPVDVFGVESNLSLLCQSYVYAPHYLELAAKSTDPVQRMKNIISYNLGCTISYIKMDKPFNPILGETYQALIDGCPLYGEQISHHPPISSTLFKGRGYTIYGTLQAKVNMGMNTANGTNEGFMYISFDEKDLKKKIVKYYNSPGELTGLTMGERKFSMISKSHYIDLDNMVYVELNWGKHKGKSQFAKFADCVQGKICQLSKYANVSDLKNVNPKQIIKEYGMIAGRWTGAVYYENQVIFDSNKQFPYVVEDYPCPLKSDAHLRKDLRIRCQNDFEKAQVAKEELEEIQRNDRKLREKYTGKKQH